MRSNRFPFIRHGLLATLCLTAAMAADDVTPPSPGTGPAADGVAASSAQVMPATDPVLVRLAAAHAHLTSASGRITQRTSRRDTPDEAPKVLTGTFAVLFPDKYDVQFTRPGDEEWRMRLCSDGVKRWRVEQAMSDQAPDVSEQPAGSDQELRRIVACLRLDLPALRQEFTLSTAPMAEAPATVRVTLKPLPGATTLRQQIDTVTADFAADDHLVRLVIDDPQGNRYDVTLADVQYDAPLEATRFTIAGK
jgi:outer membrane lipoprotein-sorting protein